MSCKNNSSNPSSELPTSILAAILKRLFSRPQSTTSHLFARTRSFHRPVSFRPGFPLRIRVSTYPCIYYRAFWSMLHEVGIQFPCVMSAYPRIRVSMFSTAYPRIRVSTSQYSLKFTWGGVVLSTAYPRIQPFQRCSFKMAGYSAVKPKWCFQKGERIILGECTVP